MLLLRNPSNQTLANEIGIHRPLEQTVFDLLVVGAGPAGLAAAKAVEIANNKSGQQQTIETPAVFSFIGATPRTDWLPSEIERDAKGFVRTGTALTQSRSWRIARPPFLLETSRPGVFAAGDVRSGSVKRVASAVGEGAMAVQFVHEYLKEM
jgi:thioredoxin reductase (NADPH)